MDYTSHFKKSIEVAERTFGTGLAGRVFLHKAILGPPKSGKATLAEDYAREIMAAGMLKTPPVTVDLSKPVSDQQLQFYFDAAQDGMIILKNPFATTRQETLYARIAALLKDEGGILVLTGPKKETEAWITQNHPLITFTLTGDDATLLTERSYTEEEQHAFNENRAAAWQAREDERRREKIVKSWREAVGVDITPGKSVKVPKRASFNKTSGPVK